MSSVFLWTFYESLHQKMCSDWDYWHWKMWEDSWNLNSLQPAAQKNSGNFLALKEITLKLHETNQSRKLFPPSKVVILVPKSNLYCIQSFYCTFLLEDMWANTCFLTPNSKYQPVTSKLIWGVRLVAVVPEDESEVVVIILKVQSSQIFRFVSGKH